MSMAAMWHRGHCLKWALVVISYQNKNTPRLLLWKHWNHTMEKNRTKQKKPFQQIPAKPWTLQFSQWVHGLTCKNIMDSVRCSTSGWPVNCRTIGLNARERSENLQLLSPQVSTGLWMRENGANHCQALAAKGRKWTESQHLPLMRLECAPCSH